MNKQISLIVVLLSAMAFVSCKNKVETADYQVVPLPKEIKNNNEKPFILDKNTVITYPKSNPDLEKEAGFLSEYICDISGIKLKINCTDENIDNSIKLNVASTFSDNLEAYQIIVNEKDITITSSNTSGIFYGIQTLRKSLPIVKNVTKIEFPSVTINDYPRFSYRGMHLDVSRHFFPFDSLKVYIDVMALHNLNKFHLHLTDDQGWRFEVKKYPELTKIGAWRSGTIIGKTMAYDTIRHGGFYTQEELRDLVKYAEDRHITIIPEIDLPGHMLGALATYPELGCTGGPYEVWRHWGVSEDVICAGNENAMQFLEDVLLEVMDVFPSEYIHIGGDEVPRDRWRECPKCQAKIKELGIKGDEKHSAEDYLQSYVMSRMEQFVENHGRHIIGWDEMLDGELAPNATVMSWRGSEGGYKAAKMHHNVIMTPNDALYFDYYQTLDTDSEPISIGGYNPVKKVYNYEPIPERLDKEEQKYILGPQANIWTEYTSEFGLLLYRLLPRIGALAEIQWCLPEQKNYGDWVKREYRMTKLYDLYKWKYATHIFDIDVDIKPNVNEGYLEVNMSKLTDGEIMYIIDNQDVQKYTKPLKITENCRLTCFVKRLDGSEGKRFSTCFNFSKASMKPIVLKNEPHKNYTYEGAQVLIDGLHGGSNYRSGRWLGWYGKNADAVIDLQYVTEIEKVRFNLNINMKDWIFNAKNVKILVSDDGLTFSEVANKDFELLAPGYSSSLYPVEIAFEPVTTCFVEVVIEPFDCPKGHAGYGYPAWIFLDEIEIY
ncbi:MAG: family 20 glycosylhydrolase [Bacteroidales bacterium]|nr:family 20 glycosylhydrolase [Bacteroidales bacterium]